MNKKIKIQTNSMGDVMIDQIEQYLKVSKIVDEVIKKYKRGD